MKPGVIYQGVFVNQETDTQNSNIQQECTLNIYDTAVLIPDADDPQIIPLALAERPVIIEVIDNSEDNFTPIRSKQLQAEIFSGDGISISLFAYGADKRYKVEYLSETQTLFIGWLSISDLSMDFLPDPNVITMIANDGLGYLNDIPLTDFDGENPTHENQIMDYIAWILSKTGLELNIVCCFNIRSRYAGAINNTPLTTLSTFDSATDQVIVSPTTWFYPGQRVQVSGTVSNNITFTVISVSQSIVTFVFVDTPLTDEASVNATFTDLTPGNSHFYKHEWLDAKTFEDQIGTCIDSYEALLRILKEEATCYQDGDSFFIMRKDEYEFGKPFYLFTFDFEGNFVSASQENFEKSIGVDLPLSWMDESQKVMLERSCKSIEENFEFEQPKEIPENSDLSRGTVLTATTLQPESWVLEKGYPPVSNEVGYIFLVFVDGEETERFLRIEIDAAVGAYLYFRNENKIPLKAGDKFSFSCDWRYHDNPGGSGHYRLPVVQARLYGDDGSHWTLNSVSGAGSIDPREYWLQSDSTWATNNRFLYAEGEFDQDDMSEWQSASWQSAPAPVNGRLEIFLMHNYETHFRGKDFAAISFEYIPYVKGTYQKYTGQQYKVEQALDTVAVRSENVFVTDTLKILWKGTLLRIIGQRELYSGAVTFTAPDRMVIGPGYYNYLFTTGTRIIITGTNAGVYKIESIAWSLIGNATTIILKEQTISSVTEAASLSQYIFDTTDEFYNAAVYPDGDFPEDAVHPYGHLQAFDVWNQYNRIMSKFEGTIDGLDSEGEMPDLKHKYFLTDTDQTTSNKMFQLLHFSQDQHLCSWNAFLHEVADSTIDKTYTGLTFKLLTEKK